MECSILGSKPISFPSLFLLGSLSPEIHIVKSEILAIIIRDKSKNNKKSRTVAWKPRDAGAILFGLKFADSIHYKFKSSQASKASMFGALKSGPDFRAPNILARNRI